jgi:hypothetical protein
MFGRGSDAVVKSSDATALVKPSFGRERSVGERLFLPRKLFLEKGFRCPVVTLYKPG